MKKGFIWFLTFILVAVAGFLITSLCLASNHGKTLTEEWKSWVAEKTEETEDKKTNSEDDFIIGIPGHEDPIIIEEKE